MIEFHRNTSSENIDDNRHATIRFINGIDITFLILKVTFLDPHSISDLERDTNFDLWFILIVLNGAIDAKRPSFLCAV